MSVLNTQFREAKNTAPTRPDGDASNAIATTAFVTSGVAPTTVPSVNSIASLRLLTIVTVATVAIVQAYTAGGSTGGGTFQYVSGDVSSADDGGLIIVDAAGRRWYRIVDTFATRQMFGATAIDDVIAAAYARDVPLFLHDTEEATGILEVDPSVGGSPTANFDILNAAIRWQQKCLLNSGCNITLSITGFDDECELNGCIMIGGSINNALSDPLLGFGGPAAPTPLIIDMGSIVTRTIDTGTNITWTAKVGQATYVSVTDGGTTYLGGGSGTFGPVSGPGGSDFTFTVVNGVVTGGVVTTGGTGLATNPSGTAITMPAPSGGGVTATALFFANADTVTATIPLTSAPPANAVAGMPVGIGGIAALTGVDAAGLNGAARITAVGASSITVATTFPRGTGPSNGVASRGTVYFPPRWFAITGGYNGNVSGHEGFFNANDTGRIKFDHLYMRWKSAGDNGNCNNMMGIHTGVGGGNIRVADRSIILGFPKRQLRIVQSFASYINRAHIGGDWNGAEGLTMQSGGATSLVSSAIGGLKESGIIVGRGCALIGSASDLGASDVGIQSEGGEIQFQGASTKNYIACCVQGLLAKNRSSIYTQDDIVIMRCDQGEAWDSDGMIVANNTFIDNTVNRQDSAPQNYYQNAGASINYTATAIGRGGYATQMIIADDAVGTFVLTSDSAICSIISETALSATAPAGSFTIRTNAAAAPTAPTNWFNDLTNVAFTTGVLTGTTGTDGKLTISIDNTTRTVYIENRLGGQRIYNLSAMATDGQ